MNVKATLLAALLALAAAPAAHAWDLLATRDVADRADHDEIALPGARRYDHIRICVERRPVRFYNVEIHYHNGGRQHVNVAARIPPGGCTRAIDLNGIERNIDRISLFYQSVAPMRRATAQVAVYGE